jgi:hypothetical protein
MSGIVCCEDAKCVACYMLQELLELRNVLQYMRSDEYKSGKLDVD